MSFMQKIAKVLSFFLSSLLLLLSLASCSSSAQTVMSCDEIEVDEDTYRYWYMVLKDYYLDSYDDIQDTQESWNTVIPSLGITYGEFVDDKIRQQIRYYIAGNVLFEEYDLSIPKNVTASIDEDINDAINAFGSRSEYDEYLEEKYGIDSSQLRKINLMEQRFYLVYDHLYNDKNGIDLATAEEIDAYYRTRYARIKYYMVQKNYDYERDEKGNRVTDASGNYVLVELNEEEKAANKKKIDDAYAAIQGGESIDTYIKADYPDLAKSYPNGYYVIQTEYYGYLFTSTIINATFDMAVGEVRFCENEDAYFLVQRYDLPDKAYEGSDKNQFTDIATYAIGDKFEARFAEVIKRVTENTALVEAYSVLTVD